VQGPQGPSLFAVNAAGVAEARPVRLGPELAEGWVIEQGLRAGDKVIVDGIIRVRPGAAVKAVPAAPAGGQTAQSEVTSPAAGAGAAGGARP
jgi:membrane fusion protein (multidrug efflux system)